MLVGAHEGHISLAAFSVWCYTVPLQVLRQQAFLNESHAEKFLELAERLLGSTK